VSRINDIALSISLWQVFAAGLGKPHSSVAALPTVRSGPLAPASFSALRGDLSRDLRALGLRKGQ
jgi:hypothetical protein